MTKQQINCLKAALQTLDEAEARSVEEMDTPLPPRSALLEQKLSGLAPARNRAWIPPTALAACILLLVAILATPTWRLIRKELASSSSQASWNPMQETASTSLYIHYEDFPNTTRETLTDGVTLTRYPSESAPDLPSGVETTTEAWGEKCVTRFTDGEVGYCFWQQGNTVYLLTYPTTMPQSEIQALVEHID